jgi:hypothetical protein
MNGLKPEIHTFVKNNQPVTIKIYKISPKKPIHKSLNRPRHGIEKQRVWERCAIWCKKLLSHIMTHHTDGEKYLNHC